MKTLNDKYDVQYFELEWAVGFSHICWLEQLNRSVVLLWRIVADDIFTHIHSRHLFQMIQTGQKSLISKVGCRCNSTTSLEPPSRHSQPVRVYPSPHLLLACWFVHWLAIGPPSDTFYYSSQSNYLRNDSSSVPKPKWKNIVDFSNLKIETPYTALKSTSWPLF